MASLIALSYIAKSAVSKVYEFDSKRHKLKPGEHLVVTGRGKPKLVMTKDEYVEHKLNNHKREFREGAHKRGYTTLAIDPNHNPQFANMLRHEIKRGKPYSASGNNNLGPIIQNVKHGKVRSVADNKLRKVPVHDSRANASLFDTNLTRSNRSSLDQYNKTTGFKPKKGSKEEVIHRSKHAVRGVHYGSKPKTDHDYKIHYTQNMVDEEVNRHTNPLEQEQFRIIMSMRNARKPLTPKQIAANKAQVVSIQREIDMHNKKAVKHQKYVNDLVGHSNKKLITNSGMLGAGNYAY